ncbi:MAG: LexA family protein [Anaerorhabdus sp.]|uniref:LexA family protein n=1 Tax=Anaerorhabdus sp. TaxID=1872524 RepID=UPI003A8BD832
MASKEEIFATNLKHYMKINNKNQNEIAEIARVHKSTVSEWLNAKKYPRLDKIQILSDYFGIWKSDLMETFGRSSAESKGIRIPVLGRVIAGIPIDAIEEIIDYEEISCKMASTGEFFALQIKGDSMEPQISENDVVIVKKQNDVESNQIANVLVNGHEATVKKIIKKENGIMLVPFNNDYEPLFYTSSDIETLPVVILGRVVELRKKY